MTAETLEGVIGRMQAIESDLDALRRQVDGEALTVSDRQYVSRCFDLLSMELDALREYLRGIV